METREINENTVEVVPEKNIDITNCDEFKDNLLELIDRGYINMELDFQKVSRVDSSGLGKILLVQKKLRQSQGTMKIRNITDNYVRKLFDMINLSKIVEIEE